MGINGSGPPIMNQTQANCSNTQNFRPGAQVVVILVYEAVCARALPKSIYTDKPKDDIRGKQRKCIPWRYVSRLPFGIRSYIRRLK